MEISFMEKPALAMNIEDFVNGLNAERLRNKEVIRKLLEKGIYGEVTSAEVRRLKSKTFNSVGTLTVDGLMDIFFDLKRAGLSRHATIRGYMSCVSQAINDSLMVGF